MQRLPLLTPVGLLLALLLFPLAAYATPGITRISFTERSDDRGYVIRIHTTGKIGAYSEPERSSPTEVTLTLYNTRLEPELRRGEARGPVQRYTITPSDDRVVISFQIDPNAPVEVAAYPDRDSDDILLGMTYTPSASRVADGFDETSSEHWALDCIVLDAGHGGHDGGATSNGVREKDVTLGVVKKVGQYVEDRLGIKVIYTRKDDRFIELHERGRIANESCGKLFVSVHANAAGNQRAHGSETYFLGLHRSNSALDVMERENSVVALESDPSLYEGFDDASLIVQTMATTTYQRQSEQLASLIQDQFEHRADRPSRGVKQAGFLVLWRASMPAVLIELGFVTNAAEARYLRSEQGQDLLASAIFRAIRDYKEQYERGVRYSIN